MAPVSAAANVWEQNLKRRRQKVDREAHASRPGDRALAITNFLRNLD
jgi:hypothetical protein